MVSVLLQEYNNYSYHRAEQHRISSRAYKPFYYVKKNNIWTRADKAALNVGDVIKLDPGTIVPYESEIQENSVQVTLTTSDKFGAVGSRYISYKPGDIIKRGEMVNSGEAIAKIISMANSTNDEYPSSLKVTGFVSNYYY